MRNITIIVVLIVVSFLIGIDSLLQCLHNQKRFTRISTSLFARKHLAVTYGGFLDSMPRKKPKKMVEVAERLGLDEEVQNSGAITGDEQRKERNRNLKTVKETQGPLPDLHPPTQKRKWSDDEIRTAIECLNRSYSMRSREELTEEQRIGVIDWSLFDMHAEELIPDYLLEGTKTRTRVMSWINYHRRKLDIRFEHDRWIFDPEGSSKRGKDKRKVRAHALQVREVFTGLL